jgi:high-affinity nickel-transport protein
MLVTDGLNGWWIARLIARADEMAALASRIMGAAVAAVSLLVAALGLAGCCRPPSSNGATGANWLLAARWC